MPRAGSYARPGACCMTGVSADQPLDLRGAFTVLAGLPNIGPFFAWQVLCDVFESGALGVVDENAWCQLGPGAAAGIDCVFGRRARTPLDRLDLASKLTAVQTQYVRPVSACVRASVRACVRCSKSRRRSGQLCTDTPSASGTARVP